MIVSALMLGLSNNKLETSHSPTPRHTLGGTVLVPLFTKDMSSDIDNGRFWGLGCIGDLGVLWRCLIGCPPSIRASGPRFLPGLKLWGLGFRIGV